MYLGAEKPEPACVPRLQPWLRALGLALMPSFMRSHAPSTKAPKSALNLACLDGLRGMACLVVANDHYTGFFSSFYTAGFGSSPENRYLVQLPILTLPWQGDAMVYIFFVTSGVVLSIKPLSQMRQREYGAVLATLASTTLRRWLRLYIPVLSVTLFVSLAAWMGVYDTARAVRESFSPKLPGLDPPPKLPLGEQLWTWCAASDKMMREDVWHEINLHTWTIPIELRGSFNLFVALLAVSRLHYRARLLVMTAVTLLCYYWGSNFQLGFFAGAVMADVYLEHCLPNGVATSPLPPQYAAPSQGSRHKRTAYIGLLLLGLFLCSAPRDNFEDAPLFSWLQPLTPGSWGSSKDFWKYTGSIFVVAVVTFCRDLDGFFTHPLVHYLGKISFALYLVHGPILRSLTYSMVPLLYAVTGGVDTTAGLVVTWALGALVTFPVVIWVADIFWRCCDMSSVRFARWFESKLLLE